LRAGYRPMPPPGETPPPDPPPAAPPEPPQELIRQLAPGGRMLVPIGEWPANQDLTLIRKSQDGVVSSETVKPVRFGPMIQEGK
jgi:protein-L-isoaspartate(D-aspartate) O-methyltransferase